MHPNVMMAKRYSEEIHVFSSKNSESTSELDMKLEIDYQKEATLLTRTAVSR